MLYIYFGSIFAAVVIYFIIGLLLFLQRKNGERSRMILAGMTFLSMLSYIGMIVYFFVDPAFSRGTIMSVPFLLIGLFVVTIYLMYPIEVISPGWLNWRRLIKMYIPITALFLFYCLTLWLDVYYHDYQTIGEMVTDVWSFQLIFRIVLMLFNFLSVVLLYFVPYTRLYNNTDHKWIHGYIIAVTINMAGYLYVNVHDTFLACSIYFGISILCTLYITYQELYVRLIQQPIEPPQHHNKPKIELQSAVQIEPEPESKSKEDELFERLEKYMNTTKAWVDPELSAKKIVSTLYSNRTSLLKAIQKHGYSSYTSYVNNKRVAEFIQIISKQKDQNYQQTFFDVGFRNKTTALRNFKDITGMIPSEYFKKELSNN